MFIRITDNIWNTPYERETDRPNLGYIMGEKYSVMVDAGTSPAHTAYFLDEVEKHGFPRPDFVFITHSHWDHTYGLASLSGMTSIAGEKTNEILKQQAKIKWSREQCDHMVAAGVLDKFCTDHLLIEYPDAKDVKVIPADISFKGEMRLDIGGETLLMKKITSGHTDDCYILLCEKAGVLFFGDANSEALIDGQWIDHHDPLKKHIEELENIDFSLCLTGHVPIFTRDELLDNLKERLRNC